MEKYQISRRTFLQQLGLVTAGTALAACAAPTGAGGPAAVGGGAGAAGPAPDKEIAPGVLRSETLILENPTGRVVPADDFNRWRPGIQSSSTGCQQLA